MPDIACTAGTYTWKYIKVPTSPRYPGDNLYAMIPNTINAWQADQGVYTNGVIPTSVSAAQYDTLALLVAANSQNTYSGFTIMGQTSTVSITSSPIFPTTSGLTVFNGFVGPTFEGAGFSNETGTVQIYLYEALIDVSTSSGRESTLFAPGTYMIDYGLVTLTTTTTVYQTSQVGDGYWSLTDSFCNSSTQTTYGCVFVYLPVSFVAAAVGPPAPITLQIEQNQDGSYTPQTIGVLTKYDGTPVRQIRAKFDTTRVGVIEPAINGGFLLYEEVTGSPSGTIYVYDNTRAFVISVPAAQIGQYRI